MNCRICNKKNARTQIKEFLYDGGDFVVCGGCKDDYNNHNIESISKKIARNSHYELERHQRKGGM